MNKVEKLMKTNEKLNIQYQKILEVKKQRNKFVLIWGLFGSFGIHRFILNKKISGSIFLITSIISFIVLFTGIFTAEKYTLETFFNLYTISSFCILFALLIISIIDLALGLKYFEDKQKTIMEEI